MPEVFSIILFTAWPHDGKVASKVKASSLCLNNQFFSQNLHLLFHRNRTEINKKLLAVFSAATCFALPEIHLEKGCDRFAIIA